MKVTFVSVPSSSPSSEITPSSLSSSSSETMREHPLLNSVVLDVLFKFLATDFDSLTNAKLVCKAWMDVCKKNWDVLTVPIVIVQNDWELLKYGKNTGAITLSQFLQQQQQQEGLNKPKMMPQRNFILKDWWISRRHFTHETGAADADGNRLFWNLYGKNIHVLTLSGGKVDFINVDPLEKILLAVLPNLERLTIENCKLLASETEEYQERNNSFRFPPYQTIYRNAQGKHTPNNGASLRQLQHKKLKYIRFQDAHYQSVRCRLPFPSSKFFLFFPNLEEIYIHFWCLWFIEMGIACQYGVVPRKLKKLDMFNMGGMSQSSCIDSVLRYEWNQLSLEKLTLNCGFETGSEDLQQILNPQAATLQTLHLCRAPFASPFFNFPCEFEMPKLTELHLWGNVTGNLNFLEMTSSLRVLKWNVTCYTEDNHGERIHFFLEPNKYNPVSPVLVQNIVENTNKLGADFKLESLTTLEIEWEPVSLESWQKLGVWLPSVNKLKGVVSGDDQLALIGKQWPDIEFLQLAHGSSVSANGLLNAVVTNKDLANMHSLIWKPCPCPIVTTDDDEKKEGSIESELREHVDNVVLPWSNFRTLERQGLAGSTVCLHDLFDKAVALGGECIPVFLEQLNKANELVKCFF